MSAETVQPTMGAARPAFVTDNPREPIDYQKRFNPIAVAAFIACWLPGFSIPAIVLGVIGRRQAAARDENGRGLALAGIILGAITLAVLVLGVIGLIVLLSHNGDSSSVVTPSYPSYDTTP